MTDDQGSGGEGSGGHGPDEGELPESLLPYEAWTEDAFRGVAVRALSHVAANGLPGDHHFYITFRTDHPQTVVPPRLRARYPEEMTIVLQHKFWDLVVDEGGRMISVGLSFGGAGATLRVPFDAMTGFADPSVKWGLRFRPMMPEGEPEQAPVAGPGSGSDAGRPPPEPAGEPGPGTPPAETPQVVSLDAFRRRRD